MPMTEKMRKDVAVVQDNNISGGSPTMRKRIGSTVYEVRIHFNPDAKETMQEKLVRLATNDLNTPLPHATMAVPQTDWLPERSAAA